MIKKFNLPFLFLFLFFLISNFCISQSDKFSLGIKGGISVPDLKASGNNPVSKGWSSRLGPYTGVIAALKFNERFSLQAELNYSSQGGKKNGVQAIATSNFTDYIPDTVTLPTYVYAHYKDEVKLNYLELPLLLKVNFNVNNMVSFFIDGGPYAGYLINAKNVTSGSSKIYFDENLTQPLPLFPDAISFDQTVDIKSNLKKFNYGIQGGVGFDFKISDKSDLMVTAGGNYGLVKIQKDKANGENNTGAATVTLGYLIQL